MCVDCVHTEVIGVQALSGRLDLVFLRLHVGSVRHALKVGLDDIVLVKSLVQIELQTF
jgi:hypothetical protein